MPVSSRVFFLPIYIESYNVNLQFDLYKDVQNYEIIKIIDTRGL